MDYYEFLGKYVTPFDEVKFIYEESEGFIVWRLGTGGNVELLHIRSRTPRQGYGRRLVYRMLNTMKESPPYHSVFGFTRISNTRAIDFYKALGFYCQRVEGLYSDGEAALFWQEYNKLIEAKEAYERNIHENSLRR